MFILLVSFLIEVPPYFDQGDVALYIAQKQQYTSHHALSLILVNQKLDPAAKTWYNQGNRSLSFPWITTHHAFWQ